MVLASDVVSDTEDSISLEVVISSGQIAILCYVHLLLYEKEGRKGQHQWNCCDLFVHV